ncbi:unnamed protein product [Phaeothamnion confervicola]
MWLYGTPPLSLGANWYSAVIFWTLISPTLMLGVYSAYKCYTILRYFYCRLFLKKTWAVMPPMILECNYPMVTVQICCYNEYTVIKRTIDAAASILWPPSRFEVMVCDDSTDETRDLVDEVAAGWVERGINVVVFRRGTDRTGYKAGMLEAASHTARGDFILMFDADHMADPNILQRGMGHFFHTDGVEDKQIGLVQFPWAYYNLNKNVLTQCDGLMLDVSFVMDQKCRGQRLRFFGFNGTGGIWRKEAIAAGGGWSWDTVTEDLDLSYKAHINGGYKFVFREDTPCALELPSSVAAYKGQKWRWSKGFAQVTVKSLMELMRKPKATLELKIECFFHLTGGIQYCLSIWGIVFWPILHWLGLTPLWYQWVLLFPLVPFVGVTLIGIFGKASYGRYVTFRQRMWRLRFLLPALIMGCGMSLNEGYAFVNGLFSKDATFVRTPKEGKVESNADGTAAIGICDGGSATDGETDDDDEFTDDEDEGMEPKAKPVDLNATAIMGASKAAPTTDNATIVKQLAAAPQPTAPAAPRKKPRYKAASSMTWVGELFLAAYAYVIFALIILTRFHENSRWYEAGSILSVGYFAAATGFFLVGIQEPRQMLKRCCRCSGRRSRSDAKSATGAADGRAPKELEQPVATLFVNAQVAEDDEFAVISPMRDAAIKSPMQVAQN